MSRRLNFYYYYIISSFFCFSNERWTENLKVNDRRLNKFDPYLGTIFIIVERKMATINVK